MGFDSTITGFHHGGQRTSLLQSFLRGLALVEDVTCQCVVEQPPKATNWPEHSSDCDYVRGLEDTAPDQSIFVSRYLNGNFLGLVQKGLPMSTTKRILKDALRGLAAMHDKDIVHNGKTKHFISKSWDEADKH